MEGSHLPKSDNITAESSDAEQHRPAAAAALLLDEELDRNVIKRRLSSDASTNEKDAKKPRESVPLRYIDPSIHLTTVQRAPAAHNMGCVFLESLIGDADLEFMVQINYMVDIDFIMAKVHESIRDELRTIVYHGLRLTQDKLLRMETNTRLKYPNITLHRVPVPGIGTHHTKAMLLFYRDGAMQFVVHTANMIEPDWRNKTQAVFTTGRLSKKPPSSALPTCAFERDLLEYLQCYHNSNGIVGRVSQYDFTDVRGVLIGSVPGKFTGLTKNKWGHLRLRTVLRQQVEIAKEHVLGSKIICQISSVGSLGKESQDWLRGEFEMSLNAHRNSNYMASSKGDFTVIYPTAENVRTSYDGWSMGGSLPFRSTSYNKQAHYMNPLLHSWRAIKSGRERSMPHIKTFTRVTSKAHGDYISWFLLTSANLSKPAWGTMKNDVFAIQSYELGVLVFPGLFEDLNESGESLQVYMMNATVDDPYPEPLSPHPSSSDQGDQGEESDTNDDSKYTQHSIGVVPIRLPYDLPLKKYEFPRDQVWLMDKYFQGMDDFGSTLDM
ncbi:tyrosyl-DNA phosphodiesterase I [Gamsiella multidivaricata]|uniref:tyrosyl-DNA phosphodiesterase I n=1 Tax=Gamsiella multidivaricata TaxID=101098 RepID=UPI00221EB84A|nr:tyrosyl-DNA phosphodiesterase I [Gamsiella multidivaricata]KAI7818364.1 tyrosyl-DNA phosphodiesterase I [Gamsiella multidivaricata]